MLGFLSLEISRQHSVQALGGGGGRGRWGGEGYNTIFLCTPDLVAYCFHVVYSLCPWPCVGGHQPSGACQAAFMYSILASSRRVVSVLGILNLRSRCVLDISSCQQCMRLVSPTLHIPFSEKEETGRCE